MRGEEFAAAEAKKGTKELPPHARRRVTTCAGDGEVIGITSACAEKSMRILTFVPKRWNYLRMRGEETSARYWLGISWELPPHARRRGGLGVVEHPAFGITSACAEKRFD